MVNRSKQKGTSAETAQVTYLRSRGAVHAERRTLGGQFDKGDIAGLPGVVIESKSCKTFDLGGWLAEAHKERDNAGADIGVVWFKKRGTTDPGKWYVLMDGETLCNLLVSAGYIPRIAEVAQ